MADDAVETAPARTASRGDQANEGADASTHRPSFGPDVAPEHVRLDAERYDDIYVVGDVHGCIADLRKLWDRLNPGARDLVVFVGDLVRKGPDSESVVEFVAERDAAISVRGNNESKVVRGTVPTDWSPAVRETIASFPLVVSWGQSMAVHGGVHPDWAFPDHDPMDLLEMRAVPRGNSYDGPFWFESYEGPPRVFFGHTVLAEPAVSDWAVGLDTGCVYGGALSAYDCTRNRIVSVEAERAYRSRDEGKIVEPPQSL